MAVASDQAACAVRGIGEAVRRQDGRAIARRSCSRSPRRARAVCTGTPELATDVLDPDTDEVCHPIVLCWLLALAFSDDDCSICADTHPRTVTLAYPHALCHHCPSTQATT